MNWENCDFASDGDEIVRTVDSERVLQAGTIYKENELKKHLQLEKVRDPSKDAYRKAYITLASRFGQLLLANNYKEIARSLLTEDCEVFLLNFGEISHVKYTFKPQDLTSVYQGYKVIKRDIKETNVDCEAAIAFQTCYCEIRNEQDNTIIPQFSMEVFSFRDAKIRKYRASFGSLVSFDEFNHPFTPSPKDKMLAKVKQLNIAWANKPNFERIASLFDPCTEHKIWRWGDQKGFIFYKNDFAENFKNSLEEDYAINCVVPYQAYSEGQYIISNYVFYLEGKNKFLGEKFIWLSTCIYMFDKHLNLAKVNQQGELHRQDEVEIPFDIIQRDKIKQNFIDLCGAKEASKQDNFNLDTSHTTFSFELSKFGSKNLIDIDTDHVKGFNEFKKLSKIFEKKSESYEWSQTVDFYVDHADDSYDIFLTIEFLKGTNPAENAENFYTVKKFYFENGKLAKLTLFVTDVPEMIPSPYDDKTFTTGNIKSREDFPF